MSAISTLCGVSPSFCCASARMRAALLKSPSRESARPSAIRARTCRYTLPLRSAAVIADEPARRWQRQFAITRQALASASASLATPT